jgi:hypothetical protein
MSLEDMQHTGKAPDTGRRGGGSRGDASWLKIDLSGTRGLASAMLFVALFLKKNDPGSGGQIAAG